LQRQRDAVEATADAGHGMSVRTVKREAASGHGRPLTEERSGVARPELLEPGSGGRKREGWDGPGHLTRNAEPFPARGQDGHGRGPGEQVVDEAGDRFQEVLAV